MDNDVIKNISPGASFRLEMRGYFTAAQRSVRFVYKCSLRDIYHRRKFIYC